MAMMTYTVTFTIINLILLAVLLAVYLKNYQQLRASFSLGLLLFASIFVIQKFVSIFVFVILMHDFEGLAGVALLLLEILQTLAFSILAWITVK